MNAAAAGSEPDGGPGRDPAVVSAERVGASRIRGLRGRLATLQKALPGRDRLAFGAEHGVMSAAAALGAYLPAEAFGFPQSFWGAITAIAVVQTEFSATRTTARDQFTSAAVGGMAGVGAVLAAGQHWAAYALAVVLSVTACWLLNAASAARLAGVTATIVTIVPHQGSPERVMLIRVSEVGWGLVVAVAVVWVVTRLGLTDDSRGRAAESGPDAAPRRR